MLAVLAAIAVQALASPASVVHASEDDCEIIVAIGRSQAAWGDKGPDEPFSIDGALPDGRDYREDCPWRSLGVGDPIPAIPGKGAGFAIDRPTYGAGGATASAQLSFTVFSERRNVAPFTSLLTCKLVKRRGHWSLDRCDEQFIN